MNKNFIFIFQWWNAAQCEIHIELWMMHNYWDFPNLFTYESLIFLYMSIWQPLNSLEQKKEIHILVSNVFTFCETMIEQEIY